MRLLSLLVTLLVIGLLLYKQLGGQTSKPVADVPQSVSVGSLPNVPSRPEDVAKFGQQMDAFMQNSNADMERKLKQAEGN
jgi:hypothetical protein